MIDPRAWLIHEDRAVLAFAKPSGVAVQGGSGVTESLDAALAAFARDPKKTPKLVHRLDRETSGVIVAAKTRTAAAALSAAFADRSVSKTYLAIVCGGAPEPATGLVEASIVRTRKNGVDIVRVARAGEAGAQAAATGYDTLAATPYAALLQLSPQTGRMHQIRIHLAHLGRPIAGDGKYGGLFALDGIGVPRLMLHALALDAPHPTGGRLRLQAPPPADFAALAEALGLAHALPRSADLETV